jgi:hypothetical protein
VACVRGARQCRRKKKKTKKKNHKSHRRLARLAQAFQLLLTRGTQTCRVLATQQQRFGLRWATNDTQRRLVSRFFDHVFCVFSILSNNNFFFLVLFRVRDSTPTAPNIAQTKIKTRIKNRCKIVIDRGKRWAGDASTTSSRAFCGARVSPRHPAPNAKSVAAGACRSSIRSRHNAQ